MFRSIDTERRKLHGRTLTPNTQRMQVCILNPCCKRIARHRHSAHALCTKRRDPPRRAGEEGTERKRESDRERERARKKYITKVCKCAYYEPVASALLAISAVRAHSAWRQISFACLSGSQEPKRWVHGATMNQHAQVCNMVGWLPLPARCMTQLRLEISNVKFVSSTPGIRVERRAAGAK